MKANQFIQDSNKLYTQKKVLLEGNNSKQYEVIIDTKFRTTKSSRLIGDMVVRADYCKKNDIEFDFVICQWAMMIKQFTNVKFNMSKDIGKLYEHELQVVNAMADLGIIEKLFAKFEDTEMKKVEELFKNFGKFTSHMHGIELDQQIIELVGEDNGEV